jgi:hypothetical protein
MKKTHRILLAVGFSALLLISWAVAIDSKSPAEKQTELIEQANALIADEIFVRAMPLLEEAAGYDAAHTIESETLLKTVYLELMGQSGIRNKYTGLLEKQMGRSDVTADVFAEAANFYLGINRLPIALTVLKEGIARLNDQGLIDFYEAERYAYKLNRDRYADVTEIVNGKIQVSEGGLWGLANSDGSLLIPCAYDKVSNYDNERAVVMNDGEIYAVDANNNRVAVLHEHASDIGNYGNDRIGLLTDDGWRRANGELAVGNTAFEEIGTYAGGYAAAKQNGKWGVVDTGTEWLIPAEYDGIVRDELGRCYAQKAIFVRKGGEARLFVDGTDTGFAYEDARPFAADGWAAVKKDGKWGFVDTSGTFKIEPRFDDALSFGGHLAAVKRGELWGYVALTGKIAIEPQFSLAKSFLGGDAPVLIDGAWQFISLIEYEKGVEL